MNSWSPRFLPWGRNVLSLPRSWPANRETDFAAPGNKHHPQPVSCILIGSVTKASAFTDNLKSFCCDFSLIIDLIIIFSPFFFFFFFFFPFFFFFFFLFPFLFSIAVGTVPLQLAAWS